MKQMEVPRRCRIFKTPMSSAVLKRSPFLSSGLLLALATSNVNHSSVALHTRLQRIYRALCFIVGPTDLQNSKNLGQSKRFQRLVAPALGLVDALLSDGVLPFVDPPKDKNAEVTETTLLLQEREDPFDQVAFIISYSAYIAHRSRTNHTSFNCNVGVCCIGHRTR